MHKQIILDGVTYVPAELKPLGKRAVVVVDRGWIFAGDVVEENNRIRLNNAVHVIRWEGIGFDGMIANPKSKNVVLKAMSQIVDIPATAEVFRVEVEDNWGL